MNDPGLIKRQAFRISGQLRPSHVLPAAAASAVIAPAKLATAAVIREPAATAAAPTVTPAEIEQQKEEARAKGLALGREQGRQEAEKAARDKLAALEAMIATVSSAWEAERDRMQALLADFAFVCTNRLLGDCLRDPDIAASAVRSALAACDGWQELTLEVHAGDLDLIQGLVNQDPALSQKALRVVASNTVQVGGCRISSNEGSLDARLEVQLAALRKHLDVLRAEWKSQP